jgi:hypothetical protein
MTEACAECHTLVHNLFGRPVEERWRPANLAVNDVLVSDQGRVARLLPTDYGHRYPRTSVGGKRYYNHTLVAEAFHGLRPRGLLVLHYDDDPNNPTSANLRFGTAAENAADRRRNRRRA